MPSTRSSNRSKVAGEVDPPAKASSPAKKKNKPPKTDPSTWPESKIDPGAQITAGDIKQYYHLPPAVYSSLSRTTYPTNAGYSAHLYNEREVEQAAWKKYGSPEGYEAHLEDLRERQAVKSPQNAFLTPSLRKKHTMVDWDTGPSGIWKLDALPPVLRVVKDRFPPGSEWLWKRCNEVLEPDPYSMDIKPAERARVLGLVLHNPRQGALIPYPLRPPGSLASSESVDKLREILARAPRTSESGGEDETGGMVRLETFSPEWDEWYEWSMNYEDEVLQALIDVVKQHGTGDEGWASARWEVYDTHADCVSGIWYDSWKREVWGDSAKSWLDASTMRSKLAKELQALIEGKEVENGDMRV